MAGPIEGGCACGAIRYVIAGDLGFSYFCQCRRCQRLTGTGHSAAIQVGRDQITVTGEPSRYVDSDSEAGYAVTGEFCAACGAPLFSSTERFPGKINIHAGSLDDPSLFKPQRVVFRSAAQHWDYVDPDLE